jgi:hypothetical protein
MAVENDADRVADTVQIHQDRPIDRRASLDHSVGKRDGPNARGLIQQAFRFTDSVRRNDEHPSMRQCGENRGERQKMFDLFVGDSRKNTREVAYETPRRKTLKTCLRFAIPHVHERHSSMGQVPHEVFGEPHDEQVFVLRIVRVENGSDSEDFC